MGEDEQALQVLIQRINDLVVVLDWIKRDLDEIVKVLKQKVGVPTPTPSPTPPAPAVPSPSAESPPRGEIKRIDDIRMMFPKELEDLLTFEEEQNYIVIKPRQYLGHENFAKVASIVRGAGGEYISAGKESHFRIPREESK